MEKGRTNCYANSTHAELHVFAGTAAAQLRGAADYTDTLAAGRTAGKWRAFGKTPAPGRDRQLANLLDALARQVHHGAHIEGDAEQQLRESGATLLGVFGPRLVNLQRNARHLVVLEAANVTLRTRAEEWLAAGQPGRTTHERALASNQGLAEVLAELELLRSKGVHAISG